LSIPAGRRWLDVGCGTGALCTAIVDRCSPSSVTGVEPSEGFLRTPTENLADRATLHPGSATAIPLGHASVGYVPYFGQPFLPAFGRDQDGLDGINLPFLGISGTADTTAPIIETEIGMSHLTGTRELVALSGVEHGFDLASTNDIFTWTLTFLDAEVRGNPATQKQLSTMASVAGGGDDSVVIFYNGSP
jgi:SAM-dependent methyltransferase